MAVAELVFGYVRQFSDALCHIGYITQLIWDQVSLTNYSNGWTIDGILTHFSTQKSKNASIFGTSIFGLCIFGRCVNLLALTAYNIDMAANRTEALTQGIAYVNDNTFGEPFRSAWNNYTASSSPTTFKVILSSFNPFDTISCHKQNSIIIIICDIHCKTWPLSGISGRIIIMRDSYRLIHIILYNSELS